MKLSHYFCFITLVLFSSGCSNEFDVKPDNSGLFIKLFGGFGNDEGKDVLVLSDGYLITGTYVTASDRRSKMYLAKVDLNGNLLWEQTISELDAEGKEQTTFGRSIEPYNNGYLLIGEIIEDAGQSSAYIVVVNNQGTKISSKNISYPNNGSQFTTKGVAVVASENNDIIIIGTYRNQNDPNSRVFISKLNQDLNLLWLNEYGVTSVNNEAGFSIIQSDDGGFLWCGTAFQTQGGNSDMRVVKVNGDGQIIWSRYYGGNGNDTGSEIKKHPSGYAIIGSTTVNGGSTNIFLQIIDSEGNPITSKQFGGSQIDEGLSLDVNDSGILITGSTQSDGEGLEDIFILKTDIFGNTLWATPRIIGGTGIDIGKRIRHTPDGGSITIGTLSFEDDPTICLIKTDKDGKIVK